LSVAYVLVESNSNLEGQTIQFDAIPSKVVGDDDFELLATSSSGLPVYFASRNPEVALVENNNVHIIGTGSCEIVAFQDGDTNYRPANQIVQLFNVDKGDQTINFTVLEPLNYADEPQKINATTSSGLPCSYSSSKPGIVSVDGDFLKVNTTSTDTILITAQQEGNVDYNPAEPVSQLLVINAKTEIDVLASTANIEIYPNPATIQVKIKSTIQNSILTIYNSAGVPVYTGIINGERTIFKEEIGSKGVYFVRVNNLVKKLVLL